MDSRGQILQVHLVDNPRGWWHDAEVVKGVLAPLQKFITFAVAFKFALGVVEERKGTAKAIYLDAMVNHQIDRHQRIDFFGIAAQLGHGVAQRCQIDHTRHPGEVLKDHARRLKGDFHFAGRRRPPRSNRFHGLFGDLKAIGLA